MKSILTFFHSAEAKTLCQRASDYLPIVSKLPKSKYDAKGSEENGKLEVFLTLIKEILAFVEKIFQNRTFSRMFKQVIFRNEYYEKITEYNNRLNSAR
jgi:hypothetical protein